MKIGLRSTVKDNHGNTFIAWLGEERGKLTLYLKEKTGATAGKWSWSLDTLLGRSKWGSGKRVGNELYLEASQKWYVTGMKKLVDEAEFVAERKSLFASEGIARELLKLAKELLADSGSEVEEVEEIEPQGSTPIKERRKEAAREMYELYYSNGGHGGPYKGLKEAKKAALELLDGDKKMYAVEARPYSSTARGGYQPPMRGTMNDSVYFKNR